MDRVARTVAMYQQRISVAQIAAACEMTKNQVYRDLHVARLHGILPRIAEGIRRNCPTSGYSYAQSCASPTRVGSMRDVMQHLTPEVIKWLADMTTAEITVADVIRSIIVDAFEDSK